MEEKKDYGKTLNLPKTNFQMRANLPNKEPLFLKEWTKKKIYEKSLENKELDFILHDGPPYANGRLHIGHALNKILKDIILKYKRFQGYNAPYVPGWDTHGLPIELKVFEEKGEKAKEMSPLQIREHCAKYAKKWVEVQKKEFQRLGVFGEWDNPYMTLNPLYEAKQLEVFGEIYENGYVFKGLKPIYWSPVTETALAEAEIEYKNHVSPSIYVKVPLGEEACTKLALSELSLVIWTTTPWTLPANVAISLNADFTYGIYKTSKGNLAVAKDLAETAFKEMELEDVSLIKEFKGADLEKLTYKHPFLERTGTIILGDHVTVEAGTGCVHTAPGHGQDDYVVGTRYGLEVISPVDNKGHMTAEAGELVEGMFYKKANKVLCKHLEETGHLLKLKEIEHSYPHDWRSKTPVIFRATEQWFISVENSDIRSKALEAIDRVDFTPSWGINRIKSMVEGRPDWCISRQRTWGVPIPIFYRQDTGMEIFERDILDRVIEFVKKEGSNAWLKYSPEELIGAELLEKYNLMGVELRKETNIMDVWFDSGVSHRSVLEARGLKRPADLYLEGSDQHRGWFQTSLLTSIASTGDAPYKRILTHGFVNDGEGKKMSKSIGNVVYPEDVIKEYGADILRLWCASVDYREDVRISPVLLKQMSEAYRRVRNTVRYILGNINDFDPKKDLVPQSEMLEIDKWAMHKLEVLKTNAITNYDNFEFYNLFHEIHYFAGIDMSAFYLDIIKDRLYTEKSDSKERRSAQTVMYHVLMDLTKMIAPILTFTAEEIWKKLPLVEEESIFLSDWYELSPSNLDYDLEKKWDTIVKLKKDVNKLLEVARQGENKIVGNSLDAKVSLFIEDGELLNLVKSENKLFEDVLIVSQLELVAEKTSNFTQGEELKEIYVLVEHAAGEKCPRCWKYSTGVDATVEEKELCPRCHGVMNS